MREVAFYERLPGGQRELLLLLIARFITEKQWWGAENLVVTDEMKVIVAAYACLIVLENPDFDLYPRTKEVILYPREFGDRVTAIAPDGTEHDVEDLLLGETHYRGPVLLAWDSIKPPARNVETSNRRKAEIRTPHASEGPSENVETPKRQNAEIGNAERRSAECRTPNAASQDNKLKPGGRADSEHSAFSIQHSALLPSHSPSPSAPYEPRASTASATSSAPSASSADDPLRSVAATDVERESPARGDVILHEFAHALDSLDGLWDGTPPLGCDPRLADWVRVFTAEYEALVRAAERGRRTFLDPYGAEDPTEFFAVATEAFFLEPNRMKRHHASLYQQLAALYRQDPALWMDA